MLVCKRQLTDGLYDHGVHFVWTELQLIARETEEERQTIDWRGETCHNKQSLTCEPIPRPWHSFQTEVNLGESKLMSDTIAIVEDLQPTSDKVTGLGPDAPEKL